MLKTIWGAFRNDLNSGTVGQIVEVDDFNARRYIEHRIAEPADTEPKY